MPSGELYGEPLPAEQKHSIRMYTLLLAGVSVALAFGVLSFGAVQEWSIFVLRSASIFLFFMWALVQMSSGELKITRTPLYAPALAFAALILFQMFLGFSAYRHDTLVEFLNCCCYGLLAFVTVQSLRNSDAAGLLATGISLFGLLISVFALVQYFASNGDIYWVVPVSSGAWVFGPYVNHNHYAGLMELLVPFPLVFALQDTVSIAKRILFGLSAVIMGVSLFYCRSRGGIIAFVCQIVLLALLGRFRKMKRGAVAALLAIVMAMAILLAVLGASEAVSRISTLREPGRADVAGWRMRVNRDSLAMVRQRPLLGWGLGTFTTVYPRFRSFYDDVIVNTAHNDYMQVLVETGITGAAITLGFLVVVFREGWRNLQKPQSPGSRGIVLAAMVSVSGIVIHSASDFNLHVPANAAIFFVMCTLAAIPLLQTGHRESPRHASTIESATDHKEVEVLPHKNDPVPQPFRVMSRRGSGL